MKKVLFLLVVLVSVALFTGCTDLTDDLNLENEETRLQLTDPDDDGTDDDDQQEGEIIRPA
ncbi:hypothetical protein PL373_16000 [Tenacibaculum maritimum]|nr:hypothetical protein [Tenacibaculum maritimum]MDB0602605.1 hypothetical protein [Tenacibaculum maritimum]MDB0611283.1 hypothetical protein [Tenacibaculum maritimum]